MSAEEISKGAAPGVRRSRLGWLFVSFSVLTWGTLVIVLKLLVTEMAPLTLTWYRFAFGALAIFACSGRHGWRDLRRAFERRTALLIVVAGLGISGNYVFFLSGLHYLTPGVAQVVMQILPYIMVAGGVMLYGETFARRQGLGVLILLAGSILFFNQRYEELQSLSSGYTRGVLLVLASTVTWAVYLLAQRRLIRDLNARTIVACCYIVGIVVFYPFVSLGQLKNLSTEMLLLLALVVAMTTTSYVAFSAAMRHLDASKAGLALPNVPIVTLVAMAVVSPWIDRLEPDSLNAVALLGALTIVGGSIFAAGPNPLTPDHNDS